MSQAIAAPTTRRAAMAAALSLPLVGAAVAAPSTDAYALALAEAKECIRLGDQVNAMPASDPRFRSLCDEWLEREQAFLKSIEAMPVNPENAKFKALAVRVIHIGDDWTEFLDEGGGSTDQRLLKQMVECLTGGAIR